VGGRKIGLERVKRTEIEEINVNFFTGVHSDTKKVDVITDIV
jgi:hypothetical protein